MRVGIDVSILRRGVASGTAVYAYNLARALLGLDEGPELVLYFGARASKEGEEALERLGRLGATVLRGPAPWRWSPDGAWWLGLAPRARTLWRSVDVYHFGEFYFPRGPAVPCVATVHDLTPQRFPEQHQRLNRALHDRRLRWIVRHAARVIVVSDATRRDLLERTGIDPARADVVHEARGHGAIEPAPLAAVLRRHRLTDLPYVLMVGTLEPRKNHVRTLHAFEAIAERFPTLRLALAGDWGWRSAAIRRALEASPARHRVHVLGRVREADLPGLYAGARVFAFPSLYEGFGIPLLEAMAAGTPVLTSDVSSMPEVAGDAALLVDPHSVDAIRAGLERLLTDEPLRARLVAAGRTRERTFTWARAARRTLDVYLRAGGRASSAQAARRAP